MKSFHNTTNEPEPDRRRYEEKAKSQEERLLDHFQGFLPAKILLTPSAALDRVFNDEIPITSVRRALSNLERDGHLEKSGKAMGAYGRPEHYWKLADQDASQQDMFGIGGSRR